MPTGPLRPLLVGLLACALVAGPGAADEQQRPTRKVIYTALTILQVESAIFNKPIQYRLHRSPARAIKHFNDVDACTTELLFHSGEPVRIDWRAVTSVAVKDEAVALVGTRVTFTAVVPDQPRKLGRVLNFLIEECVSPVIESPNPGPGG